MDNNLNRHKCEYCGWLFRFDTNFIQHECFKHYTEGSDHINVGENYIVTILEDKRKQTNDPVCKDTLDELLIGAVRTKPGLYNFRIPASQRSILKKNSLWAEVANTLGGAYSAEAAKARWKYLRDNYIKARKKVNTYIPSGSSSNAAELQKSKFKFYELMKFLNDFLETRPTVSSLSDDVASSMGHLEDVPSSSEFTDISPPTLTTISEFSSPVTTRGHTQASSVVMTSGIPSMNLKGLSPSGVYDSDGPRPTRAAKKHKSDVLEAAIIEALKESPPDPLDGFLTRLGEGMRRLPYRDRARLEIRFLTQLAETEDLCANRDSSSLPLRY